MGLIEAGPLPLAFLPVNRWTRLAMRPRKETFRRIRGRGQGGHFPSLKDFHRQAHKGEGGDFPNPSNSAV